MTDPSAHVELRDYQSTVPKAYIGLAWLWWSSRSPTASTN